jgi:hypothetical protein
VEQFPVGKLKDMVDAAGGAFNKLATPSAFTSAAGFGTGAGDEEELWPGLVTTMLGAL